MEWEPNIAQDVAYLRLQLRTYVKDRHPVCCSGPGAHSLISSKRNSLDAPHPGTPRFSTHIYYVLSESNSVDLLGIGDMCDVISL